MTTVAMPPPEKWYLKSVAVQPDMSLSPEEYHWSAVQLLRTAGTTSQLPAQLTNPVQVAIIDRDDKVAAYTLTPPPDSLHNRNPARTIAQSPTLTTTSNTYATVSPAKAASVQLQQQSDYEREKANSLGTDKYLPGQVDIAEGAGSREEVRWLDYQQGRRPGRDQQLVPAGQPSSQTQLVPSTPITPATNVFRAFNLPMPIAAGPVQQSSTDLVPFGSPQISGPFGAGLLAIGPAPGTSEMDIAADLEDVASKAKCVFTQPQYARASPEELRFLDYAKLRGQAISPYWVAGN